MTTSSNPPSAVPRLGPAWRGKGSGFQPPPAVPDAERRPPPGGTTSAAAANANSHGGTRDRSNSNPFSALDDEEEGRFSHLRSSSGSSAAATTAAAYVRSSSAGLVAPAKPRSLADLVASAPRRGSASAGVAGSADSEKVLRYTREKLLSLRPRPAENEGGELPEILKHLEGSVVVTHVAQDPVCWDDFHPEEIWAAPPPPRERRTTDRPLIKPLDRSSSGGRLRDVLDSGEDSHPSSSSAAARPRSSLGSGGRWQRGVALPPGNNEDNRRSNSAGGRGESGVYLEAEDPNDLWDDPGGGGTGAAPDFSQFGASLDEDIPPGKGKSGLGSGAFELSDMSRAAAAFEMELHGEDNGKGEENGEETRGEDSYSHRVDESRPLASSGTTIRSGSGDHVNVFEDFGEEEEEAAEEQGTPSTESAEKEEDEEHVPIKSGNEMSASSRLMKMIGVGGSGEAAGEDATITVESKAEEPPPPKVETVQVASVPSNPWGAPVSIPSNPWSDPVIPDQSVGLASLLNTQRAREAEIAAQRQREEEQRRRLMQEEEEKKRWAEMQAKQQAEAQAQQQQQQQLRQQQQNQVELVLIERISNILENSWGRSDLVSILSTLHADDSRVIAILSNPEALRALITRHPQRITLVRDPAMGAEMAALILTNQQWQMQQARLAQQQQAQAQAQAREQQELQRRRALEAQQQRQRLEALAREREAQERQMQLQQQQQQQHKQTVIADAPWFYADPQGNIQGPFGGDEMRQWLEAGYFKGNLPISQNNSGPFRPLSTYFPDPTTAFQPRVDEARAQAEARQKQAELAAAAAELKRREEEAARAQAEAQQRELEARARLKAEAESRMRAEEEAARIKAEEEAKHAAEGTNQNDQSVQLKMLLGLGGTSDAVVSETAPQPAAKKQSKSKAQQKQASAVQESSPVPVTEVAPAPAAPAWGVSIAGPGAGRKKTMSEIQQEEAKAAAKRAAEGGIQRSGGGWANVAATGGSTAWGGAAAKIPAAGVIAPNTAVIAGVASVQKINSSRSAATINNTQSQQQKSASNKDAVDNFGANGKMTPAFEKWCISQMQKINNSDDLTLVSFCMTLTDPMEIRQYLTAYLGSTPEVNNFATEFIKKKGGDNSRQEEWESAGGPKKGRKKKGGK